MYEVIMAIDGNEKRAKSQVESVANLPCAAEDVHVTLFHDFTDNPHGASVQQVGAVRETRERLEAAGIEVTLAESSGDPASAILDAAAERDADLVCLACRNRSAAKKAILGSVTQEVLQETDYPVLVCSGGE